MSNDPSIDPAEDQESPEPSDPLDLSKAALSVTVAGFVVLAVVLLVKLVA